MACYLVELALLFRSRRGGAFVTKGVNMSERITDYQLEQIARMIREELIWLDVIGSDEPVIFDKGSKNMGRAYRIYTGGYSDKVFGLGDGYLGQTKREAWLSLRAILRTLEAVRGAGK